MSQVIFPDLEASSPESIEKFSCKMRTLAMKLQGDLDGVASVPEQHLLLAHDAIMQAHRHLELAALRQAEALANR